jgi:hypothetical protein
MPIDPLLEIGPHVTALPVVHGSGDFAWEVRRLMLTHAFDCVAVPLPPSFQQPVENGILDLPVPSVVVQRDLAQVLSTAWDPESDAESAEQPPHEPGSSFVPIDPCQPVIAALRTAMGDRIPRRFIDLETGAFLPYSRVLPDAYALKKVPIQRFAAAVLPHLSAPQEPQWQSRIDFMAWQLRELSVDFKRILFVTSILDWPWIRQSFHRPNLKRPENDAVNDAVRYQVKPKTFYFLLGEIPFITDLYEQARAELTDDANLSIDGVKELLIAARADYRAEYKNRARRITPKLLTQCLKYTRNLTLIDHRMTPQLATIVIAAQQVAGDGYALHVLEKAKQYSFTRDLDLPTARMGVDRIAFEDSDVLPAVNRLPGPPLTWLNLKLIPKPDRMQQQQWKQKWNPFSQCSWPPEDEVIENFRQTVFDRARQVMGADLAKTEKFTTSIKDGIDIRDTLRHWYDGEIYVKVLPPNRGKLDCAVMLFDSPADPRDYAWRTTWFAEHEDESTLAFFASDFTKEPVGPGICLATYGGVMFIYPPRPIPDIWTDPRLDFASTLEERLLAAACLHSECPQIALVSPGVPGPAWRFLSRRFKKTWIHLPLSRFSDQTIQQLRMVHVLNGREVRSYAANFIRRS